MNGEDDEPEPSWGEIFAGLAEQYHWTFDSIASMSFDQIVLAWNGGKVRKGIPVSSPESILRAQEAMLWEMRNGR